MELLEKKKNRFRIEKLEPRIAPAGLCITDPLFCGELGGGSSAVTADADAFLNPDGTTAICAGNTGGSNPTYELSTNGQPPAEATLGICSAVFGPGPVEAQDPCPAGV